MRTPAAGTPFLSVVIPAYNETANLQAGALDKVAVYLQSQPCLSEVLIVDDGSADDTAARAEAWASQHPAARVIRNPHRGKADAVATGLRAAAGEIVLFTDMDQATPIGELAKLLPWFEQGYAVVIGSRGRTRRNAPGWRKLMSLGQIVLRDLILGFHSIQDTQCGFKAFRRDAIAAILPRLSLYRQDERTQVRGARVSSGFDVEMLFIARKLGYRIKEVPVEWDYRRTRRVNLFKDSARGLRDLIQIRLADWRGEYDR